MSFKDILVHVDATNDSRTRIRLALSLARRFGARLAGFHVIPEPVVPPYFKPSAIDRIARIYAQNARVAAKRAEALFLEEAKDAGAATAWECVAGDLANLVAERARFTDLLLLGQFDTENPRAVYAFLLPAKVVFGTATPILVVPNDGSFAEVGRHALVTWDGSREAARAVRDALPLLEAAHRVSLLAIDPLRQGHMHEGPHTSEMVAYLGRHGVNAEEMEVSSGAGGVTGDLLDWAGRIGADLLVMGAYGHSPVWEFVMGGTTQDLLERARIPVLMSR